MRHTSFGRIADFLSCSKVLIVLDLLKKIGLSSANSIYVYNTSYLESICNILRRRGTKCDCNRNWLWVRYPLEKLKYLLKFIFSFFGSGVALSGVEFLHCGGKWVTECLNPKFPLPTLLCVGYSETDLFELFIFKNYNFKCKCLARVYFTLTHKTI